MIIAPERELPRGRRDKSGMAPVRNSGLPVRVRSGETGSAPAWMELTPPAQVQALRFVTQTLRQAGVQVLVGGAFAIAHHVGRWRGTKDVDLLLRPRDRDAAVAALTSAGFADFFDQQPYDRTWIYRAHRPDALVDLIWTLPNHVTEVADEWFAHAPALEIGGEMYRVVAAEELIWIKLFVLQRDRCDWPDVLNLLRCRAHDLNWNRLLRLVGSELPLLQAALSVLAWLAPQVAQQVPETVRIRCGVRINPSDAGEERRRAALLDSRAWYAPFVPEDHPMGP